MPDSMITVTLDQAKLRAVQRALRDIPGTLPRIMVRALRRTAAGGRTQLDALIRRRITAKKRDVMGRITDEEKATVTNWRWRLGISRRRLALAAFRHTVSDRRGITATIRVGETTEIRRGFATAGFRHYRTGERIESGRLLWRRAQKGDKSFSRGTPTLAGDVVRRMPIVFLRGPSIAAVVANAQDLLNEVHAMGTQRLAKEVDSQVRYELARRWPK